MHINSVKQAMAAGLIKKAAEETPTHRLCVGDLVTNGTDVYRVVCGGAEAALCQRTRDDRGCHGVGTPVLLKRVYRMVADITVICCNTRLWRVSPTQRCDGRVVQTPGDAAAFIEGASKAYIYIGMGRAWIPM